MKYTRFIAITSLLTAFAFVGCETSDDIDGNVWNGENSSSSSSNTNQGTSSSDTSDATTDNAMVDAAPFSSFDWSFGGFNGSSAQLSSPRIGNLRISGDSLTYSWTGETLRAWGLGDSDAGALACLFVQKADGTWIGGKFDWISTSRTSRGLEHVYGYNGWNANVAPNPCEAAFVIVSKDGKKRSNVIKGTWTR